MRPSAFPEKLEFWAPKGTRAAVREAAGQEGQTLSEFIRAAVRNQLRRVAPAAAVHAVADTRSAAAAGSPTAPIGWPGWWAGRQLRVVRSVRGRNLSKRAGGRTPRWRGS